MAATRPLIPAGPMERALKPARRSGSNPACAVAAMVSAAKTTASFCKRSSWLDGCVPSPAILTRVLWCCAMRLLQRREVLGAFAALALGRRTLAAAVLRAARDAVDHIVIGTADLERGIARLEA